jgi:hypothetical protein
MCFWWAMICRVSAVRLASERGVRTELGFSVARTVVVGPKPADGVRMDSQSNGWMDELLSASSHSPHRKPLQLP